MRVLPVFCSICLLLSGCVKESLEPTVNVEGNVLLPVVQFSTSKESKVYVSYWPAGKPASTQQTRPSSGRDHRILLPNVLSSTRYEYNIHTTDPERTTNTFSFSTGALPSAITQIKKIVIDTAQFDGYILIRRLAPLGVDVMLDNSGNVVWYHLYDTVVRRPFTWTQRQTVLSVLDSSRLVEYNIAGDKLLDVNVERFGMKNILHHDAVLNDQGNVVALSHDSVKMDLRNQGYSNEEYVRGDGIVVFDREGKLLWKWNILDVYDPRAHPDRKLDLTHSVGHANSIAITPDGNYAVSFRDFSQIWKINSSDGSVMWTLGKDGDIKMDAQGFFLRQHAAYYNSNGDLMLFDNGDRKTRPESRILCISVDEKTRQATIKTNVVLPLELSADKMCSAVLINPGKYLVCTSKRNGIITVVNDKAEILWRVDLNSPSYRAYYLSDPFSAAE